MLAGAVLLFITSCGPVWRYRFDLAEQAARRSHLPMLVFYKDALDPGSGEALEWFNDGRVAGKLGAYVLCKLANDWSGNRAFVAQFGVQSTPAVIVVHRDGSYHATTNLDHIDSLVNFLEVARPPGAQPDLDATVPRRINYRWRSMYQPALKTAEQQNRRLLIVYKWWLDRNSTKLILDHLRDPEVFARFSRTVNCLLDWNYVPNRAIAGKYGVDSFPAMIIVEPDGSYRTLSGLPEPGDIVAFAQQ
jgi:hypothetical protein